MSGTRQSSTGRRLVAYTVLCSTAVALVATAFQLYADYAQEVSAIEASVDGIRHTKMEELNHAMWVRDDVLLRLQLEGLVATPGVMRAVVRDGDTVLAEVGGPRDDGATAHEHVPIQHVYRGRTIDLGTLTLEVSHAEVYDRIQRRLLVILGSNALKTAVVALLMLLLFRSLVTRHLDDLASYLDTDQVGGPSRPLALDRPPDDTDEIGRTVVAVNAMVARSTDQFERTHAQREEIERLNVGLVARLEEMQSFSYSLAHDLSGPLRTAHSFAEIVHEDIDDADQQDLLMRIQSACQRMNDLIAGMLRLSDISRMQLHPEAVDLSAVARQEVTMLMATYPERSVEVRIEPGLSTVGDTRLLQTAVESLLRNAWTFTASRPEAVVEVGYGEVAGREGFYVRDNGIGFDPEHSARIFSPFERLHPESAGSGVGLAVVRTVVARHGGEVWAEARPDEGATFAFSIGHLDTGIHQVVSSG